MKKYDVIIWKQVVKSTTVVVEAEDEEDAKEAAWDKVWNNEKPIYWNEKTNDSSASAYENKCC